MLRVFDRAQDAALALPPQQSASATGEQLQQRYVGRVEPALGHDVAGQLLRRHRSRRVP